MVGAIALAVCILCPLIDMFDQWDHALQNGHDSEYPLVIMAMCVGAAFMLGRLIVRLSPNPPASIVGYALRTSLNSICLLIRTAELAPFPGSPPFSLRI